MKLTYRGVAYQKLISYIKPQKMETISKCGKANKLSLAVSSENVIMCHYDIVLQDT